MRSSISSSTESSASELQITQIAINSVTILGAGTMGAQIALHCANAGIPALLLDLTTDVAKQGLERARKLKRVVDNCTTRKRRLEQNRNEPSTE